MQVSLPIVSSAVLLLSIAKPIVANSSSSTTWASHDASHSAAAESYWSAHSTDPSMISKHSAYESWLSTASLTMTESSSASSSNGGVIGLNPKLEGAIAVAGAVMMLL